MITLSDIRLSFLEYFQNLGEGRNHKILPSSSLVPHHDPTLLFTNAGMVQFKDIFTGQEPVSFPRAATSQKCVRAGGKHNDLENVGYTARHHTFFEMLGNFSFGDYFKAEAIEMAWGFVTQELQIPKEKLWVTVFAEDQEAAHLWKKIASLTEDRIIPIPTADNFWSMGDQGPCGPCSEIFYDHGPQIPGGLPGTPDADGDRFVEIWNLVFMQFEQQMDSSGKVTRVPLPKPSIDTGMGLERIAAVLQGVHNNYEIDLFKKIIWTSEEIFSVKAEGEALASHRVIADHLRASAFLIADGVLPSNEGRGYVLRRIMRRAMRHAHQLGAKKPLFWKLAPCLVDLMGNAYPELQRASSLIQQTLEEEESRFQETLGRGLTLLKEERKKLPQNCFLLPGDVAFKLYDTYGFPVDLTQDLLKKDTIQVDMIGFEQAMAKQKAEARAAWSGSGEIALDQNWTLLKQRLGETKFLGYDFLEQEGKILLLLNLKGEEIEISPLEEKFYVITDQTPFYGESGGQVGDQGFIFSESGTRLWVADTLKKAGGLFVHLCQPEVGSLTAGEEVRLQVDESRRKSLQAHHSATHLLHQILREKLGTHVTQKGSLVTPERLRFDFSHQKPLSSTLLQDIEETLNERIRGNFLVNTTLETPESALEGGAMGLFGEKYGSQVRVVSMGEKDFLVSKELCGGTHVQQTGEIGIFKILSESGVAAGVRRLEAVVGFAAETYITQMVEAAQEAANLLKSSLPDLKAKIQALLDEKKILEQKLLQSRTESSIQPVDEIIQGILFRVVHVREISSKDLRILMDRQKSLLEKAPGQPYVLLLMSEEKEKVSLIINVSSALLDTMKAADMIKNCVPLLGGTGGGGRADFAQGGGPQPSGIPQVIRFVKDFIKKNTI